MLWAPRESSMEDFDASILYRLRVHSVRVMPLRCFFLPRPPSDTRSLPPRIPPIHRLLHHPLEGSETAALYNRAPTPLSHHTQLRSSVVSTPTKVSIPQRSGDGGAVF